MHPTHPQHICNSLTWTGKHLTDVTRNGTRRWYVILGTSCFHQVLEAAILNNTIWPCILGNPADYFSTVCLCEYIVLAYIIWFTYCVSVFVCCRCEYVTLPFPDFANAAAIDPSFDLERISRALSALPAVMAWLTTSAPQHFFVWWCKFPVDVASDLSKKRWTVLVHDFLKHLNSW